MRVGIETDIQKRVNMVQLTYKGVQVYKLWFTLACVLKNTSRATASTNTNQCSELLTPDLYPVGSNAGPALPD